jgi:hypothetical protein
VSYCVGGIDRRHTGQKDAARGAIAPVVDALEAGAVYCACARAALDVFSRIINSSPDTA